MKHEDLEKYEHADLIIDTAIKAMTDMMKEYSSTWTKNCPWDAHESLFTFAIAQALVKNKLGRAYPESNIEWSINKSRENESREIKLPFKYSYSDISGSSSSDIMVADIDDDWFRFCIEVKKHASSLSCICKDLQRCADVISLTDSGTIDDAIVIFFRHNFFRHSKKTKDSRKELSEFIKTTLTGEGEESQSAASISKLKEDGFCLKPYVGEFQTYTDKEKEEHDWVVGAVRISRFKKPSN